jgi:hypothetical protein
MLLIFVDNISSLTAADEKRLGGSNNKGVPSLADY